MKNLFKHITAGRTLLAVALLLPIAAQAHKPWLAPSKTSLSVGQWITVDAGVATQPFVRDHVALALDNIVITAPDGSTVQPENPSRGKLRSTFDLQLQQAGTYKIALSNGNISASWEEDGKNKRWPPRGTQFTAEGFAKEVPKKAKNLKVTQSSSILATYVTAGAPNDGALKPTGKGLELVPVTPFTDLFVGEEATFKLLLDGKPASGVEVEVIADGIRYRNAVDEVLVKSDAQGLLKLNFTQPGLHYLSASVSDKNAEKPATDRRTSYTGIFEVLSP